MSVGCIFSLLKTKIYEKILILFLFYVIMLILAINPSNGAVGDILINNENKLLESGKPWTLYDGYEVTVTALDNERVLISLSENGKEVHRKGEYSLYAYEYRNPTNISQLILRFRVIYINGNKIQLGNIFQYSDSSALLIAPTITPIPKPTDTPNITPRVTPEDNMIIKSCSNGDTLEKEETMRKANNPCWGWVRTHTYVLDKPYFVTMIKGEINMGMSELGRMVPVEIQVSSNGVIFKTILSTEAMADRTTMTSFSVILNDNVKAVRLYSKDNYVDNSTIRVYYTNIPSASVEVTSSPSPIVILTSTPAIAPTKSGEAIPILSNSGHGGWKYNKAPFDVITLIAIIFVFVAAFKLIYK